MAGRPLPGEYEPSRPGWDRIAMSGEILDVCLQVAERGRSFAESESPVDSGRFASSWSVDSTTVSWGRYGPRVAAELVNDTPYAATVEFGSEPSIVGGAFYPGNQAQRVLTRTAEFLGLT